MAKLYQSEWNEIKQRQSGADLQTLIHLIEADGGIELADDPTEDEIMKARDQAAKDAQKRADEAQKEAEKQAKEDEKARAAEAEADAVRRAAEFPHPDDQPAEALAPEKNVTGAQEGEIPEGKAVGEEKPKAASGSSGAKK